MRALAIEDTFETLVNPGTALPANIAALTGIRDADLRRAPRSELAVRRFLGFAGDAPLAAHNARFDLSFLEREVERLTGRRVAAPVVDTVWLARRLLQRRSERFSLASLAHFFGTSTSPCHRALPDAVATAEILVSLLGLAQERGARTLADVLELAAPRARKLHSKRSLIAGAPTGPGVYLFRDRNETVLYVGKARDLRARLRSYFSGSRQRPAVEAALGALERVEWRQLGSELEAALEELRLIGELRPPANARGGRSGSLRVPHAAPRSLGRGVGAGSVRADHEPQPGTARGSSARRVRGRRSSRRADRSPRAAEPARSRPALRGRCTRARSPEGARGGRRAVRDARSASGLNVCVLGPCARARVQACVLRRRRPAGSGEVGPERRSGHGSRWRPGIAEAALAEPSFAPEDADVLMLVAGFLRRPGPELRIVSLDATEILAA